MNAIIAEDMRNVFQRDKTWSKFIEKRFLVTGAYGMIGSYIVFSLIYLNEYHQANITIFALGRSEKKTRLRFGTYFDRPYFHFVKSDLSNPFEDYPAADYIVHAASAASSDRFAEDPIGVIQPNVFGTYGLLQSARKHSCISALFISSGEVYGDVSEESVKENTYGPSDPLDARYCYGESKRMGECLCASFCFQYNVPVKIVRLGHTYGPTLDINHDKRVFSEFAGNIVRNEDIVIKSSGEGMRAFCYLADALAAFFLVLLRGENGNAYNISNEDALISIKDLAETLIQLFPEKNLKVAYGARSVDEHYIESRQLKHAVPDTEKLKRLGWRCDYDIKKGFMRTIQACSEDEK